jgi:rhamnosyltransferase
MGLSGKPRVLVLLAAYNGAQWITEQIDSILNQEGVDVELLISDDGSTDETTSKIQNFAKDPRIKLVFPPAPTRSAAQNFLHLIRNAPAGDCSHIAFADQDDIWEIRKLRLACLALRQRNAAGYSCAVRAFWSHGRETILRQADRVTRSDFMFEGAGQGCTFVLTAAFYGRLREFLRAHPAETEALHYHDWAVYAISRSWGACWVFDNQALVRYRQHLSNDTGARANLDGIKKRLALLKSGWYARQLRTIAQVCFAAAPADPTISQWQRLLSEPRGWKRKWRIAQFCLKGGRRRAVDNTILVGATLAGWI